MHLSRCHFVMIVLLYMTDGTARGSTIHNKEGLHMDTTQYQPVKLAVGAFGALFAVTALSLAVCTNVRTYADTTVTDDVTITIQSACTFRGVVPEGSEHTKTIIPGNWTPDIGTTQMTAICNDPSGYNIYAVGYTNNSYDTATNTKLIANAGGTTYSIDTGSYTTSPTSSYWSMKLAGGDGDAAQIQSPFTGYSAVPSTYTKVATYPSSTTGASGSSMTSTYGVYPDASQVAGTYIGQVKYVLVHPNTAAAGSYTITYNANGGTGTATSSTAYNVDDFTIPTNTTITRSGYNFLGWCSNSNSETECTNGDFYTDGGTIPANTIAAGSTLTLYAIWKEIPRTYMQDLTATQCQEQASDQAITVYDRRDGSDYTVRYINNACWMTQNLRITGTISATDSNFTGSDFNTMAGGDLRGSSATYTAAQSHLADSTDIEASASATGGPYTTDQLGAWYNYCAASAGEVCQNSTAQSATQDICPAGWKLPTDSTAPGNFSGITGSATTADTNANKFAPIYGGGYINGSLYVATTLGGWWSSTASYASYQYSLGYNNGSLNTGSNGMYNGFYVRCMRSS